MSAQCAYVCEIRTLPVGRLVTFHAALDSGGGGLRSGPSGAAFVIDTDEMDVVGVCASKTPTMSISPVSII